MTPHQRAKAARIRERRINRARELLALAELSGVTIGFERDGTVSFHPATQCPVRLIQEVTLLRAECEAILDGRIKFTK